MIAIISGSNRKDNLTLSFAKRAYEILKEATDVHVELVDFSKFDTFTIDNQLYNKENQPKVIQTLQDNTIIPSTKFWFFVPEYNGSYPGVVKLVLDSLSTRAYGESFASKKACITGVASGRAGNLRGMDHLADVLNHLGVHVHPNKVPISSIHGFLDSNKNVMDGEVTKALEAQVEQLVSF